MSERVATWVYWGLMLLAFAWVFSMAADRASPVRQIRREIVNPGKHVAQGERILIDSSRSRARQCELTRRWWVIDGAGRRLDYEAEKFEAYGALGEEREVIGPYLPLDAMVGRGRIYGSLAYECNMLQRAVGWPIVVLLPPLDFEIVPRSVSNPAPTPPGAGGVGELPVSTPTLRRR